MSKEFVFSVPQFTSYTVIANSESEAREKLLKGDIEQIGEGGEDMHAAELIEEHEISESSIPNRQESFPITSVSRADLEGIGFDTSNIDDATLTHLASKMANAYCDNSFWIDLPIIAEYLDIPKKAERR